RTRSVTKTCLRLLHSCLPTSRSPCSFVFFFYCSRPPRDLHSFPTRRSSDLWRVPPEYRGKLWHRETFGGVTVYRSYIYVPAKSLDRKSTRLNSSHVAISYAVFCLKKKKKKHMRD